MAGLYIVTGTSRGLGAAVAEQLLAAGERVLAIARGANSGLEAVARRTGAPLEQWSLDLADAPAAARRLAEWLSSAADPGAGACVTLINNAGLLAPIVPVDEVGEAQLSNVLRVDVEAPILLAAAFLRATRGWQAQRRVLMVSSGAGSTAYAGWSTYCAAKAALDHFVRAAALDEAQRAARGERAAQVVSLAPGVIDTAMQAQLRAADPAAFPSRQRFLDLHRDGALTSPEAAAARLLAYLDRPDFGQKAVADVRQA